MRLITFSLHGIEQVGVRLGDRIVPVTSVAPQLPGSIVQILAAGGLSTLAGKMASCTDTGLALAEVEYRPLIPRPGKIICIGRNYAAHAAEGGANTPTFPEIFYRGATSLVAHNAPIIRPQCSDKLDFEGEIAFVIGKSCRHATGHNALDFVAGYSLFNDATLRDYQRFSTQWTIGKNFDGTGSFGPELVTADELPEGIAGMTLTTKLNGEQMQHGRTDDLVFPVRRLITILSECMTLEPGDVVVTGTPSGVGSARKPPLWMKAGDTIEVEVAGIGRLCNVVRDEP
jgi:2-keto-4-pentenoate hydratase/2-oxohepta-3-ene-1,7-dioic acid hydratase in catechol pathway